MRSALFVLALLFAHTAFAEVFISEIKYTGNEWIEVSNTGAPVDLSSWKFFEGGTNHKLKSVQGAATIPTGGHAVIANDAAAFRAEYSNFTGALFDSSFSLLDIGESLSIKSSDGSVFDTVSYTGIKGSKNSTQKDGTAWQEAPPTPGAPFGGGGAVPAATEIPQGAVAQAPAPSPPPQVSADSGAEERIAIVGVPIDFETSVLDANKNPISNAHIVWTFGDGGASEGLRVSHTYYYAGDYTVILDVSSAAYSGSARILVHAVLPVLALGAGGDSTRSFITIENKGNEELDLSGWSVRVRGKNFVLPKNTILGARKTLTLPSEVTGLDTFGGENPELFFVNGTNVETERVSKNPDRTPEQKISMQTALPHAPAPKQMAQKAALVETFEEPLAALAPLPPEEGDVWLWFTGAAFLGVLALLGLRFARTERTVADEFTILDDPENRDF